MNSFMGENLIYKFNSNFELEDKFFTKEKKDMSKMSSEQMKDYLVNNLFLPVIDKNRIILVGVFNKKLKFCSVKDGKLNLQKDTIIEHFKDEAFNYEAKTSSERKSLTINNIGFAGANIVDDKFVIAISQPKADDSYLHRYDLDGNYLDSILIEKNPAEKIRNMFGFDNNNFYFIKSVKDKKKSEKNSFKTESNYLYRAKLNV